MTTATLTTYVKSKAAEWEIEIQAQGDVIRGGSNRRGSDEPAWLDVEAIELTDLDGNALPRRVTAALPQSVWDEAADALIAAE